MLATRFIVLLIILCLVSCSVQVTAQETVQPKVEVLLTGLQQPWNVAVRPIKKRPYELFVCESGAGRIIRHALDQPGKSTPLITDFAQAKTSFSPDHALGPVGLTFLDQYHIVVGEVGQAPGVDRILVWKIDEDSSAPLTLASAKHTLGPISAGTDSKTGEGDYHTLHYGNDSLWAIGHGDPAQGWLSRSTGNAIKLTTLKPFLPLQAKLQLSQARALTTSPRTELVLSCASDQGNTSSQLVYLNPTNGRLLLKIALPLADVTGLTYSKNVKVTPALFAVAKGKTEQYPAGLYRLDAGWQGNAQVIKPKLIVALDQPTAVTCDDEGTFYVTLLGKWGEETSQQAGQVLKISGL